MKRIFFIIVLLIFLGDGTSLAQDKDKTTPPPPVYSWMGVSSTEGRRFEIVRSPSGDTPFYRIDKFTGEIQKLISSSLSLRRRVINLGREPSVNDIAEEGKVNYQLTVETPTHCYLMNLNTGIIWEYRYKDTMFILMREE